MTLRILTREQLEHVSPKVRKQLEQCLDAIEQTPTPRQIRAAIVDGEPVRPPKPRLEQPEQEAGALLVEWIDLVTLPNGLQPGLFFYHVANAGVAQGKVRGGILQGQGVRAGWPDYGLDLPLGGYHGLRLELKRSDGPKPTAKQLAILERLEAVGYKVCVAWGFEDAKRQIERYLDLAR